MYLVLGQYVPELNATIGTNYFDQEYKMLKVLVRGSEPVEIRTAPVIFVSFELPTMTEEEFFGDNLVRNLAAFLKVPANMIRVTNIIREDGGARRKKRSSGLKVELEIKKPPVQQTSNSTDGEPKELKNSLCCLFSNTCEAKRLSTPPSRRGGLHFVEEHCKQSGTGSRFWKPQSLHWLQRVFDGHRLAASCSFGP